MLRNIALATLFVASSFTCLGQTSYGSLELSSKNLKTLQRFLIGDTVVLFFQDAQTRNAPNPFTNEHWVFLTPDGKNEKLTIPELSAKGKVAVLKKGADLFFYFVVEENKTTVLRVMRWNLDSGKKTFHFCTLVPDNLLVTAVDNTLVFLYEKKTNELGLIEISGDQVIRNDSYLLPVDVFRKTSEVAFIDEGSIITPLQASQPLKIYRSKGNIILTYDDPDFTYNHKKSKTFVITIEPESGNIETKTVPDPGRVAFRSIWNDGLLYRITKNKGFHVVVHDGEKLVHNFSISYTAEYAEKPGMLRDDVNRRVFNNRNVRDVLDNTGKAFIVAQKIDSGTTLLKLGTQKEVSKGYTPILVGSLPALFASLAVSSISHAMADEVQIHHFFFVKGNAKSGFAYTDETLLAEQRIDQHELFDPEKGNYRYKSYLRGKHFTVAFYVRKPGMLEVLRFD